MTPLQLETTLELPIIHLNGSGVDNLKAEYTTALRSLLKAREAFAQTTLHPRDFYPKGNDSYLRAHSERQVAFHHIDQAISYLETYAEFLSHQSALRSPRNTPRPQED